MAMTEAAITVAVRAQFPLQSAGLSSVLAALPGLALVPEGSLPPPSVLVWWPGSDQLDSVPDHAGATRLLIILPDLRVPATVPADCSLFSPDEHPAALGVAIRQLVRGDPYLSPWIARALLERRLQAETAPAAELPRLSDREREVLSLLAQGLSNKAIAAQLFLSVRTVEGHLAGLYGRLGVHSRTEAALIGIRLAPLSQIK